MRGKPCIVRHDGSMSRSSRAGRTCRVWALVVAAGTAMAACAASDDVTPTTASTRAGTIDRVTSGPTAPTTISPTPPASEPTAPQTAATTATAVTATTVSPTPTVPPTTTEPLAVQELLLRGDGIGSAVFGAAPEGVIDYVTSILGGNTGDTGWVDPFTFADCGPATVARRVDWGVLSLLFTDLSSYANGRRHFIGYEYGRVGEIGDEPVGLRTPGGITLGSRIVDLLAEFPGASVNEGESDVNIPPNFYVSDVFYGLVTGTLPEDRVTVVFGGYGCGE